LRVLEKTDEIRERMWRWWIRLVRECWIRRRWIRLVGEDIKEVDWINLRDFRRGHTFGGCLYIHNRLDRCIYMYVVYTYCI